MKKIIFIFTILLTVFTGLYSEETGPEFEVTLNITNIETIEGKLFLSIYQDAQSFKKKEPLKTVSVQVDGKEMTITEKLPQGEYVFFVYQDINKNDKLDRNFLGMPKEPVGYGNHKGGRPGGFNKLKIEIKENKSVDIKLFKI
ncbi:MULTISPECIES: DUF2141 domain-containing protein [Treponema]|uniref:DUF2141 domain-containing protein n=2 Tax=Treponema denticola TaxID=158 RepID=Q73M49_TREDE|nr:MULTISPECIES: DUF2141 domain-containing protein [Treponema]AAS12177.1 conserved hypothetical protein [Treponema denticola ATCC 35405]EMB36246.1 hypothetical protein HMPREF9726_00438 [Treponema denticola H-22]EMB37796.1 hypothetical protein HMPREF9735_01390 [Treponema denticola ATCC 33521]EMB40350.1 hypothetical protein HMPREF9721_00444 [Treponema denticola ATCC 35404]EMB46758.1 hypothetical protein HMPREF9730_00156 [Treponema denticola AL-2]